MRALREQLLRLLAENARLRNALARVHYDLMAIDVMLLADLRREVSGRGDA